VIDNITKKGTIIYRAGATAVRDDGEKLQLSHQVTGEAIEAALRLAIERYGNRITVNGSPEFKARVIQTAALSQVPITFADQSLEHRRQALLRGHAAPKSRTTTKRPGVPQVGQEPPPHRRNGLQTLSQVEVMRIGSVKNTPVPNTLEQRRVKIRTELAAKRVKRSNKGRTL
jgi:hypothetical protein